jgi:hypothetical protein|tara:strand:- start:237 stop:944 length:708 start_codon:yes stop_codon:yes gene_type:complete
MATQNSNYIIENVEALWPRINKPYRFDNAENRTVPCDPFDDNAKYEIKFRMTKDQAKALYLGMCEAYEARKEKGWPEKVEMPFTKDDEGMYVYKASLKGAYGKEATLKPVQVDSNGVKLPEDFMLTTGSTVSVAVIFVPYNMREAGISLRLKAVQVIKYVPMEASTPFGKVEGGFTFQKDDNPFEVVEAKPATNVIEGEFGEEKTPEPTKVSKKAAPKPKKTDADLASIVDDWDD